MPFTPLHFGLLAPINYVAPKKVSNASFVLVDLWMDGDAIQVVIHGTPFPSHGTQPSWSPAKCSASSEDWACALSVGCGARGWTPAHTLC